MAAVLRVMRQGRGSEATEAVFRLQAKKSLFIPGCVQGAIIQLVCLCVSVCNIRRFTLIARAVYTRPISTNPGSMEAEQYGLTRGTCFLACRLELDAVAGLLWISWCVFGGADFFSVFLFYFFFFERTRPGASIRPPCLIPLYK